MTHSRTLTRLLLLVAAFVLGLALSAVGLRFEYTPAELLALVGLALLINVATPLRRAWGEWRVERRKPMTLGLRIDYDTSEFVPPSFAAHNDGEAYARLIWRADTDYEKTVYDAALDKAAAYADAKAKYPRVAGSKPMLTIYEQADGIWRHSTDGQQWEPCADDDTAEIVTGETTEDE